MESTGGATVNCPTPEEVSSRPSSQNEFMESCIPFTLMDPPRSYTFEPGVPGTRPGVNIINSRNCLPLSGVSLTLAWPMVVPTEDDWVSTTTAGASTVKTVAGRPSLSYHSILDADCRLAGWGPGL